MPENPWSADPDPEEVTTFRHRFSYHQEIKTKTKTSTNVILCPQITEAKWEGFNSSFASLNSQARAKVLAQ